MIAKVRFGKTSPLGGGASQMSVRVDGLEVAVFQIDWTRGRDRSWSLNHAKSEWAFLDECQGKTLKQVKDAVRAAVANAEEPAASTAPAPKRKRQEGAHERMLRQFAGPYYWPGPETAHAMTCPVCHRDGSLCLMAGGLQGICSHRMNGTYRLEDMWACVECEVAYCAECARAYREENS